jgi:hypothetical protein
MNDLTLAPLTAVEIKAQVQVIQQVMESVMIKDVHYGTIPGTPKPTLYKPGSEKILSTFHIAAYPKEIEDLSTSDEIRYRVKVHGLSMATGSLIGVGIGECSSNEEKYKWRKPICPEEYDSTPEDRRREKWFKGQGNPYQQKQIRTNPADVANTILKMAKKRAQIDMTLTATAASDVFDQDLEDLPEGLLPEAKETKPPLKEPQKKEAAKAVDGDLTVTTTIQKVEAKNGDKNGKPYTLYSVIDAEGNVYKTFSETNADLASSAAKEGLSVVISYVVGKFGNDLKDIYQAA